MSGDWKHSEVWLKRGHGFSVEIKHTLDKDCSPNEGPHRWCVYAYIYKGHPHFANFSEYNGVLQVAASNLPLHGIPSYLHWYYDAYGTLATVAVGADYHHHRDHEYTTYATQEEAAQVFRDAGELFRWLNDCYDLIGADK